MLEAIVKTVRKRKKLGCSFHEDMEVYTSDGYQPIGSLAGREVKVLSQDERTGILHFKPVSFLYWHEYDQSVYVEVHNPRSSGRQTVVSNILHPYFVKRDGVVSTEPMSKYSYAGQIESGFWVEASQIMEGDLLLDSDGYWNPVSSVRVEDEQIVAYDIDVDEVDTFYIRGDGESDVGVWVHNCDIKMKRKGTSEERTKGNIVEVKQAVANAGYDKGKLECAQCKLKTSIASRKAENKRRGHSARHKLRVRREIEQLNKVERRLRELE